MLRTVVCFLLLLPGIFVNGQQVGSSLPAWSEGYLDLHHINTGRGDAAFYILPDGTTMMLDAGELPPDQSPRRTDPKPDGSRKAHEWIVRYVQAYMPPVSRNKLDYAVITHFHDDHYGGYYEGVQQSKTGKYFRAGITGVGDVIPIRTMIDRGYPDYEYPNKLKKLRALYTRGGEVPEDSRDIANYWDFVRYHTAYSGMKAEALKAGRDDQIVLVNKPGRYPSFRVRNVKSNGSIWTGRGAETFSHFIPYNDSVEIAENPLSNVLRIDYGNFRYYTGGDCPGIADLGQPAWNDVGTSVAKAVGPVDVAVLDHHGNRDSHNESNVRNLRPRVWIGQTWSADHPGHDVLRRITSRYLYEEPRDLFATNMMEANKLVIGPLIERSYKSTQGHIVVRVMPGGDEYFVIILDDSNEQRLVKAVFGPYQSSKK